MKTVLGLEEEYPSHWQAIAVEEREKRCVGIVVVVS